MNSKQKLLIATHNKGKIGEITEFLSDMPIELVSLDDLDITRDVEETGTTYYENSKLKAEFYSKLSGLPALSDDGGLEIDALNGAPGVKSRRWLGYEARDEELVEYMKKIAHELPDDNRDASFKVVLTIAFSDGRVFQEFSEVKGIIAKEPKVSILKGYPYRSFFFLPKIGKYYHENELSPEEMRQYNHRYRAIQNIKIILQKELST